MTPEIAHAAAPHALTSNFVTESAGSDERWAAWRAKGVAHDRAVRRKMTFAVPVALIAFALAVYALAGL